MKKRFTLELIIGLIGIISVIILGNLGLITLVLLAIHPFIGKRKEDEREKQVFNKVGRITAGALLLIIGGLYFASDIIINGRMIGDFLLIFIGFIFLLSHGLIGLIIFKTE